MEEFQSNPGLAPEQLEVQNLNEDGVPTLPNDNSQELQGPTGPMERFHEMDQPELVVTASVESLEQGLTSEEIELIRKATEQVKAQGKKLIIRYRLRETEEELVQRFGNGDKQKAVQVISDKFRTFIPGSQLDGVMGEPAPPPTEPSESA